jgi:hypothetical protein
MVGKGFGLKPKFGKPIQTKFTAFIKQFKNQRIDWFFTQNMKVRTI